MSAVTRQSPRGQLSRIRVTKLYGTTAATATPRPHRPPTHPYFQLKIPLRRKLHRRLLGAAPESQQNKSRSARALPPDHRPQFQQEPSRSEISARQTPVSSGKSSTNCLSRSFTRLCSRKLLIAILPAQIPIDISQNTYPEIRDDECRPAKTPRDDLQHRHDRSKQQLTEKHLFEKGRGA